MSNIKIERLTRFNTVYFTLYEKTTIPSPTYLFSFRSASTEGVTKNFICPDLQTSANLIDGAWNKFTIEQVSEASENLLTGAVNLQPEGQWDYKIYAQTSTTNLVPEDADELVEEGICFVKGSEIVTFTEYNDEPQTEKYYTP